VTPTATPSTTPRPRRAGGALTTLALTGGVLAVSTASLLVRRAQDGAPTLLIAAGRLAIAALVLLPFALARHRAALRALTSRERGLALAAGALLALHFATWIASLARTSVVSSVVLVTTAPLWVGLLAPLVLRERLARATALGLLLASAGGAAVALGDRGAARGGHALGGDLLALAGAWCMAGYLLVGRRLRARLALVPYVTLVYGAAALLLALAAGAMRLDPRAVPAPAWGWIVLLALVPQLLGHSTFNWALRALPATLVSLALLGEPVGSAVLAFLVLGEVPTRLTLAGAALVLAGVAVAARGAPAAAD
jgi:drug/metabolite transporter (DMT)-like permease